MADGLLEVRQFDCARFEHAATKNVITMSLDILTHYVHAGDSTSDLVPDYESHNNLSPLSRSVCDYITLYDFMPQRVVLGEKTVNTNSP
jgi:hypothetical protein